MSIAHVLKSSPKQGRVIFIKKWEDVGCGAHCSALCHRSGLNPSSPLSGILFLRQPYMQGNDSALIICLGF